VKALIYVRVSDDRQTDNTSLDSQEAVCREWCAQRSIEVDRVFRDAGESAKTADRPQFQEMLKYTERHRGSIRYLLVHKFNRFARNQHDHIVYATLLRNRKIEVRSATEHTDDSNFGRAMEGFISVFNQLDNDIRAENNRSRYEEPY
jgi:site-specific DNA recombinase